MRARPLRLEPLLLAVLLAHTNMKKLPSAFIFSILFFFTPFAAQAALTDSLQAYWKLDESSGNAADEVNSNTLTNNNTATYSAGKLNNACNLASGSSQWLGIANGSQSANIKSAGDYSVSFWIKAATTFAEDGPVVWSRNNATQDGAYIQMATLGGNTTTYLRIRQDSSTIQTITKTMTTNFVDGTWYHIVATFDFTELKARLYQNGSLVGTADTITMTTQMATDGTFDLGTYRNGASNFLNGSMDEFGYWNRELTSDEVTTLYGGGTPPAYPFSGAAASTFQLWVLSIF